MTAQPTEWITDNAAWVAASPRLSVLIPFMRDDPTGLLAALDREALPVEVILLDDGSGDPALAARVGEALEATGLPARFVRLTANEGRSKGRNRLSQRSRYRAPLGTESRLASKHKVSLNHRLRRPLAG